MYPIIRSIKNIDTIVRQNNPILDCENNIPMDLRVDRFRDTVRIVNSETNTLYRLIRNFISHLNRNLQQLPPEENQLLMVKVKDVTGVQSIIDRDGVEHLISNNIPDHVDKLKSAARLTDVLEKKGAKISTLYGGSEENASGWINRIGSIGGLPADDQVLRIHRQLKGKARQQGLDLHKEGYDSNMQAQPVTDLQVRDFDFLSTADLTLDPHVTMTAAAPVMVDIMHVDTTLMQWLLTFLFLKIIKQQAYFFLR